MDFQQIVNILEVSIPAIIGGSLAIFALIGAIELLKEATDAFNNGVSV